MKILIAPNAFKGTIDAESAAEIISKAVKIKFPNLEIINTPIADGGDGTCQLLSKNLQLQVHSHWALNAIGRPMIGKFALNPLTKTAYLDVSTVSGIQHLSDNEKNPWVASTFGTGELILKAIELGCEHVVLGLGGSATIDLGFGILRALGFLFLDQNGREIPMFSDHFLKKLTHIQRPIPSIKVGFTLLCDVNNYFLGQEGAIPVFGHQKGLIEEDQVIYLQYCEKAWEILENKIGKEIIDTSSYGAAGGVAVGLSAFFNCEIKMGASFYFEQVALEKTIQEVDWVITGEGKYDEQSSGGKGCFELMKLAKKYNKKIALITGMHSSELSHFDQIILLPALNFSERNVIQLAKQHLFEKLMQELDL
jgi:glycerate 2-kinase